jgi:hypothetical protein
MKIREGLKMNDGLKRMNREMKRTMKVGKLH